MKLAICICTHRRPEGLGRLLRALEPLAGTQPFEIFVVDNHASAEGLQAIATLQRSGYSVPIHSAQVYGGGISQARNHVLQMAIEHRCQFAALIDDDEWPSHGWLSELLRVQEIDNADAIGGPTRAVFEGDAPELLRQSIYYGADLELADNASCTLQACGNVLLKLEALASLASPLFDPELGQSGGEDLQFFMRLEAAGVKMRWAKDAEVFETVPPERSSMQWLKRRVALIANTRVHITSKNSPGFLASLIRCSKTIVLGLQAVAYSLLGLFNPKMQYNALIHQAKFHGKLRAHFGHRLDRGENH